MSWIDPESASYFEAVEERYLEWCDKNGVQPYRCEADDCDRWMPCRRHRTEAKELRKMWEEE